MNRSDKELRKLLFRDNYPVYNTYKVMRNL